MPKRKQKEESEQEDNGKEEISIEDGMELAQLEESESHSTSTSQKKSKPKKKKVEIEDMTPGFFKESVSSCPLVFPASFNVEFDIKKERNLIKEISDAYKKRETERIDRLNAIIKEAENLHLNDLVEEAAEIATVRKDSVFQSEVTNEEKEIIKQRVELQRKQYQEYIKREERKKIAKVQMVHPFVSDDEVIEALKENNNSEEEVVVYFTDYFNLHAVRKNIAMKESTGHMPPSFFPKSDDSPPTSEGEDDDEYKKKKKKKKAKEKKQAMQVASTGERVKINRKLRLDDALKRQGQEGWSEARKNAYKLIDINPNAYYYRFNAPGDPQKNGKWSKQEVDLFYKRMQEVGVNGQWGIFSITIPGRVGYQCSNFYRQLIESGKIKDPNYVIDEKGKAHYIFKKGRRKKDKDGNFISEPNSDVLNKTQGGEASKKKKKRKRKEDEEDDDESYLDASDEEYKPSWKVPPKKSENTSSNDESSNKNKSSTNLIPGFIDPITLCEVEKPAISPYGHVMDYSSWLGCLIEEPKNTCPFTKKPVKKRDLVILTWDNIDQYRDKIVNWTQNK